MKLLSGNSNKPLSKNIEVINKDTFDTKNNFFSARRSNSRNENDYGRNISIIMLK